MERRDFIKKTVTAGAVSALSFEQLFAAAGGSKMVMGATPDMVAVMGGEPAQMLAKALEALGGVEAYVKKGQSVVIKPNIGWDKKPELAANTNPELVGALVEACYKAGASKVSVFDHTCDNWQKCYLSSGIEAAAKAVGAEVLPANDESYYTEVPLPNGIKLKTAKIHKAILDADVWFNVPILKNHGGAKMSIAMKNFMGIVWDRQFFHSNDLQQTIADICTWSKKPALNIVDAYRILRKNGPQGRSINDATVLKSLIVSRDIVAADTAAIKMFNQVEAMSIEQVGCIAHGEKLNLGTSQIDNLNIQRIKL